MGLQKYPSSPGCRARTHLGLSSPLKRRRRIDLFVCVDCGFQLANGDVENPDPGWTGWSDRWNGYVVVNGDSEKDADFSWRHCDGCDSNLGGARMHCVAWPKT